MQVTQTATVSQKYFNGSKLQHHTTSICKAGNWSRKASASSCTQRSSGHEEWLIKSKSLGRSKGFQKWRSAVAVAVGMMAFWSCRKWHLFAQGRGHARKAWRNLQRCCWHCNYIIYIEADFQAVELSWFLSPSLHNKLSFHLFCATCFPWFSTSMTLLWLWWIWMVKPVKLPSSVKLFPTRLCKNHWFMSFPAVLVGNATSSNTSLLQAVWHLKKQESWKFKH